MYKQRMIDCRQR